MMHDDSLKTSIENFDNAIYLNKTSQINTAGQSLDIKTNVDNSVILLKQQKKDKFKSFLKRNKNFSFIPKFYIHEYKRFMALFILWLIINVIVVSLSSWASIVIINSAHISNWVMLTLLPCIILTLSFLVIYTNNFIDFRNEAKNVDFQKEKVITINIKKLYMRLKTAYININWFCALSYILSCFVILIVYLVAWSMTFRWDSGPKWGILNDGRFQYNPIFLIIVISAVTWIFLTFIFHVSSLVSCYVRSNKIDHFYSIQIIPSDEINMLKKKKNHRDAIIFMAFIAIIVLIGLYIYRTIKTKKTNNISVYTK